MPINRLKMVPAEAIVLDTEESQECHRILDWLASSHVWGGSPCLDCGTFERKDGHRWDCMVIRSRHLIEKWAK